MEMSRKTIFQFSESIRRSFLKCPIQKWEADAWARGLNLGLIKLEGYFFRVCTGKRSPLAFFIRNDKDLYVGLRRESITQAATYVSLITDLGFDRSNTRFESRWMDVVVYGEDGQALIYAENKANYKTLQKLCARLSSEFQTTIPRIELDTPLVDDAIMKAHHIWKNRPKCFWGIAPNLKLLFEVTYLRDGFYFTKLETPPHRHEWEYSLG